MIKYSLWTLCAILVAAESNLFLQEVTDADLEIQWPYQHSVFDLNTQPVIGILS